MTYLISLNQIQRMSSREIAILCQKEHKNVTPIILELIEKGVLKSSIPNEYKNEQNKQIYTEYLLDKRDSVVIVARLSPEFTGALVDRWQELENQQKPKTPQNYLEALKELVIITEEKEKLQSLNNALMHVQKSYTTSELAKELNFKSAKLLNQELHNKGIQYKMNDTWLLYAKYADMGLVEIKQGTTDKGHVYYNSQWNQKGRQFVLALFGAE